MYHVTYRKTALKALRKMPASIAGQFWAAFEKLAINPNRRDLDIRPLQGRDGYRLRIQDRRAIYTIEHAQLIILVLDIGARGDIYK